ncbi:unnamed protein product [Lupinus luteus]|uniref:VAN3-binding protein n=1 Tax=Lupinus luteus TaxID=3873 RepID=A0AAV1WCZ7_LUPLU
MASDFNLSPSDAHPETMDFLSHTWCNFALSWKQMIPLKSVSIKKWFMGMKLKRKEEQRLQRAEVHAALSIAGVAAALAAIAAENSKKDSNEDRDAAIASAAALVAAQCAKVAEAMGIKKEQLGNVISSAMSSTTTSDILTLTATAATSLKCEATLKARSGCNNRLNGGVPILPIEDNNDLDFDFEKGRSILAQGAELHVETPQGRYMPRFVCVILNSEAKVVLMMRKHNLLKSKKESIVVNIHAELYKDSEADEADTCYLIVLKTIRGNFKLDMASDYRRYKTWATTINHMLRISTSFAKYELQFY